MHVRLRFILGILVVSLVLAVQPTLTHAQRATRVGTQVDADFKGAVGLGLVGAELGAVIPALAGLDAAWAYIVFPVVGAAGGAIAGYFTLDKPGSVELSIGALTLGMALVIPALVVTLSATAYDAGDVDNTASQRATPRSDLRASAARQTPPLPDERASSLKRRRATAAAGSGMVRMVDGKLALAAPALGLVPGARANGEWRVAGVSVSLLSGRF